MVHRDPVEAGALVGFHLAHQLAHKGLEVAQFLAVLRRDDDAEMVPVLATSFKQVLEVAREI